MLWIYSKGSISVSGGILGPRDHTKKIIWPGSAAYAWFSFFALRCGFSTFIFMPVRPQGARRISHYAIGSCLININKENVRQKALLSTPFAPSSKMNSTIIYLSSSFNPIPLNVIRPHLFKCDWLVDLNGFLY